MSREVLQKTIIDQTAKVHVLSESQQAKRKEADEDLKNGNFIDGEEMEKRVAKWIN